MPTAQRDLLEHTLWDHLIIFDGGRFDVFADIYPEYLDGSLQRVHNGGFGFTANWFAHHFPDTYDAQLFHGGLPIHAFEQNPQEYDEREHFADVLGYEAYAWDDRRATCPPAAVIDAVQEHGLGEHTVIRFLQPHNPYKGYPNVTTAADAQRLDRAELWAAYEETYRWGLDAFTEELLPRLDGTVVVTADHGQCLGGCNQYLHGPDHDHHDHLVTVPWLEIDC